MTILDSDTNHLDDGKIVLISNKIQNCFLKNFPKHIKKIFKSKIGILKRFDLKLMIWDENNANFKKSLKFLKKPYSSKKQSLIIN